MQNRQGGGEPPSNELISIKLLHLLFQTPTKNKRMTRRMHVQHV